MMFKDIDNIPNVSGLNTNVSPSLGNSNAVGTSDPMPRCGCKSNVATVSNSTLTMLPFSITSDNNSKYYSAMNIPPSTYGSAFDEIGYGADDSNEDDRADHAKVDLNVTFDYMTHVYMSSISVIGLYALYRLINKTR